MDFLTEVKERLQVHAQGVGETVDEFFNRQLTERITGQRIAPRSAVFGRTTLRLTAAHVEVVEEFWFCDQLRLLPRWHDRQCPSSEERPIILFRDAREV